MNNPKIPGEINAPPLLEGEGRLLSALSPYIRQTGDEIRKPWHIGPRKLLDYLLVYIVDGNGIFTVDKKTFSVSSRDLIWIKPDTVHEMSGTSRTMHCMYIHFDLIYDPSRSHWDAFIPEGFLDLSKYKKRLHPEFKEMPLAGWNGLLNLGKEVYLEPVFKEIIEEHRLSLTGENKLLLLSSLFLGLLYKLVKASATKENIHPYYSKMQLAAKSIIEHPEKKIKIEKLALTAGLSPSHFRRIFREIHKQSAFSMNLRVRIKKSCELLAYTNENISEISNRLGFKNIHDFSRVFKRETGASPLKYRKIIQ